MSEINRCPDCGHVNPPGSASCEACNFPLSPPEPAAAEPRPSTAAPSIPRPRRPLRRRPRPASNQALQLWLLFGFIAAAVVTYVAVKANLDRASQPIEGSNAEQQKEADRLTAALAKDSTDVDANIALANILYDTGNWSAAVGHYRTAIARDSSRVHAIVDLGVCYYNLGDASQAQRVFLLALEKDPHQPVALFNLGIVHERQSDYAGALQYFHRALESAPPEDMKQTLVEAMQRVQKEAGTSAPPLPGGS
jgi:cytochrome c-type biogenesis protein CcmH/NrfG